MLVGGLHKLSLCDYPGIPAIVVFLQGCNFDCPFCHNRQLLATNVTHTQLSSQDILDYLQKRKNSVSAVVVSGGEPTLQPDLVDFIEAIKVIGYKIKLDTNGSRPDTICELLRLNLVDYIAMDIKAPWQKYDLLAGTRVEQGSIKESINSIVHSGISHHFRTTHFPPMLSDSDITEIKSILPKQSPHIVQPYNITKHSSNAALM